MLLPKREARLQARLRDGRGHQTIRLAEAHAFYRHMGYERTSIRLSKKL